MDIEELAKEKGGRIVKLTGDHGDGLALFQYEDILFNTFALNFIDPAKQLQSIKQFAYHEGDVLLCTYPKSVVMGSYIDYLTSWDHVIRTNKELKILVVYYESLIRNQLNEMKNIRDFLRLSLDDDRLCDVIDKCSFNKLREVTNGRGNKNIAVDDNGSSIIYRKGIIGDWVNHFTVAQNNEFDRLISDKLSDTVFDFDFHPSLP